MAAVTAQVEALDSEPAPAEKLRGLPLDEEASRQLAVAHGNTLLAQRTAAERIEWALENLPGEQVLTSSFGAQAAVSLHLVTTLRPDIPVIFIDTGYHFSETYRFVDALTETLKLSLRVYRSPLSPAWQEARHGQRWKQGLEGLNAYNRDNKVEPMERALRELNVGTWFAGLRRSQSSTRAEVPFITWAGGGRCKVHPIADWTDRDIHAYLRQHRLPYHPLWEKGYISIGDVHSTRAVHEVEHADQTRFFGLTRECGLHQIDLAGL